MPILHSQPNGQGVNKAGQVIAVPPPVLMQQIGPCLQVAINIEKSIADQLIQAGGRLPAPQQGIALIDTGASVSCIDEDAAKALTLPIVDVVTMISASHSSVPANVYPAHFQLVGTNIHINLPRVMGANLKPQKLIALIGRDILSRCTLFYNG